jgi:hypothetical protein
LRAIVLQVRDALGNGIGGVTLSHGHQRRLGDADNERLDGQARRELDARRDERHR